MGGLDTAKLVAIAITTVVGVASVFSAGHALLNKRDPRSQLGWVALCVALPVIGPGAYWLLGVNRIKTRARRWQEEGRLYADIDSWPHAVAGELAAAHPQRAEAMRSLLRISRAVTGHPLLPNSKVTPLYNGEQAYADMLDAIADARESVDVCTYIFETDVTGRRFVEALCAAGARGVDVRVLVDAIGERYARPRVSKLLRRNDGVSVLRFLPLTLSLRGLRVNLRNHRKLLIVDGRVGYTGGMNIGGRHMVELAGNRKPTQDIHFRVEGPAVNALAEAFVMDWRFTSRDARGWRGYRDVPRAGEALCRGISDGPNEDFERLHYILVGALSVARERVRIMTPYFIPNRELVGALNAAALRGVRVDIVLPVKSNIPFIHWAMQSMLWEVLQHGVRVHFQPPPFAHSKLFIVDDFYTIIGSANLDPRSLRLNFEFNLEVYDPELGTSLAAHFEDVLSRSRLVTREEMDGRSFPVKFRDAVFKMFSPYL